MPSSPSTRTKVFISYSHADKEWLDRLKRHLKPLVREGNLDCWDDTRIRPGDDWKKEIQDALDAAQGMTPHVEDMVVMLANTIVSTGGDVTLVATRWRQSHTTLRTRLGAVLKRAKLPGH